MSQRCDDCQCAPGRTPCCAMVESHGGGDWQPQLTCSMRLRRSTPRSAPLSSSAARSAMGPPAANSWNWVSMMLTLLERLTVSTFTTVWLPRRACSPAMQRCLQSQQPMITADAADRYVPRWDIDDTARNPRHYSSKPRHYSDRSSRAQTDAEPGSFKRTGMQCEMVGRAPDTRRDAALRCTVNRRSSVARCAGPSGAGASSPSSAHRVPTAAGTLAQCRTLNRGALQLAASLPSPANPDAQCHTLNCCGSMSNIEGAPHAT